jgi:hypothetical protein
MTTLFFCLFSHLPISPVILPIFALIDNSLLSLLSLFFCSCALLHTLALRSGAGFGGSCVRDLV